MESLIPVFYKDYLYTKENFEKFHNEVINMPRDSFSSATFKKIRSLASYLLLIENKVNPEGNNYKEILGLIVAEIKKDNYPDEQNRNSDLESRYFTRHLTLKSLYDAEGRMFRHLMEILGFFGVIQSYSKSKKYINFETCREISLANNKLLISILRNNLLSNNIKTNDFFKYLDGIEEILSNANYIPAYAILKYIKFINRPATFFEISVLLGRIDKIQEENKILDRAKEISRELPQNQDEQILYFFDNMGWKSTETEKEKVYFTYAASQEPYFKFKSFILYMNSVGLLELSSVNSTVTLSEYSSKLLEDEIPAELTDLENLLYKIDDDNESEAELMNIIINKRTEQISKAIQQDTVLVEKINKRALRNIRYDSEGKRIRNKFISELAKVKANYFCEATRNKTFRTPEGQNYVEAHHIIEFRKENGPDITENLIVLGPEKHMLLHRACREDINDLYTHLITNGVININRFKKMHTVYKCLTKEHIQTLYDKKIISSIDRDNLLSLLND